MSQQHFVRELAELAAYRSGVLMDVAEPCLRTGRLRLVRITVEIVRPAYSALPTAGIYVGGRDRAGIRRHVFVMVAA